MLELTLGISVLGLVFAFLLARFVLREGTGTETTRAPSTAIVEGSFTLAAAPGIRTRPLGVPLPYSHPADMVLSGLCQRPFARLVGGLVAFVLLFAVPSAFASEKDLILPDLASVRFMGIPGNQLLMVGLFVCLLGLAFGLVIFNQLKNLPVHRAMREISELIYETCKTYLITQGKFILMLEVLIGTIMVI